MFFERKSTKRNMNQATATKTQATSHIDVKSLTITAIFIALTYVFTAVVNIRLPFAPNGGLIHLGNVPLFIAAIVFGRKTGAAAGAVGMGLFDLLSGWGAWAPFTFVIVGAMGYTVGAITEKKDTLVWRVIALLAALVIKIAGYYLAEVILYGNWVVPASSIPGNVIQVVTAIVIVLPIVSGIKAVSKNFLSER